MWMLACFQCCLSVWLWCGCAVKSMCSHKFKSGANWTSDSLVTGLPFSSWAGYPFYRRDSWTKNCRSIKMATPWHSAFQGRYIINKSSSWCNQNRALQWSETWKKCPVCLTVGYIWHTWALWIAKGYQSWFISLAFLVAYWALGHILQRPPSSPVALPWLQPALHIDWTVPRSWANFEVLPSCLCHQRVGYDAQAHTPGHYCKGKNHGCREAGAIYQAPARILLSTNEEVGPRPFSVQSTLAPKHLSPNEAKETFQVQLGCQRKFLCTTKTQLRKWRVPPLLLPYLHSLQKTWEECATPTLLIACQGAVVFLQFRGQ